MAASTLSIPRLSSTGGDPEDRVERMVAELIEMRRPTQQELRFDPDAVTIGNLYRRGCTSMENSARYYLDAGRRLKSKKAEVGHGNWLRWLRDNHRALGMNIVGTPQRLIRAFDKFGASANYGEIEEALRITRFIHGHKLLPGAFGTGNNEWFTPAPYIAAAKAVMGGIDIDPASHPKAQETVEARDYCTRAGGHGSLHNGLEWPWRGRVWLNPPYAHEDICKFINKLLREIRCGNTKQAIVLTHNYTDTVWFQAAASMVDVMCLTRSRVKFHNERGKISNPLQGQVFFYYGHDVEGFNQVFQDFGFIMVPWRFFAC